MKIDPHITEGPHGAGIGSYKSYGLGYGLCVLLTLFAYFFTSTQLLSGTALTMLIALTGLAQIVIQLLLFIHLNAERKPRWNMIMFLFMLLIAVIVVVGSLWIMANLDYRMMPEMTGNR